MFRTLQNHKLKSRGGAQRGGYNNRARFSPGYSGYSGNRGNRRAYTQPALPQDLVSVLAAAVQQAQAVPGTSGTATLLRTNIAAQKMTSKCTRCNIQG